MQACTSLQTDNHTSTSLISFFTGRMPFLPPNHSIEALKAQVLHPTQHKIGYFGDVLPSQSFGSVLEKTTPNKTKLENTKPKQSKLTHTTNKLKH